MSLEANTDSNMAGEDKGNSTSPNTEPHNSNKDVTDSSTQNDLVSKQAMFELIEKARRDEKEKLYPELERLKTSKSEFEKKMSELQTLLEERQKELEDVRSGKVEEKETVNRELRELREQNKKLEKTIENVAETAAERVRKYELDSYREKKIREAGLIHLTDLVSGSDEASIEASIASAKQKETAIFEQAREDARKKLAADLPKPIAPDATQGRGPGGVDPMDKERLSRLKGDEYIKMRNQLLQEAKQKAGL